MSIITVTTSGDRTFVECPYDPDWTLDAKQAGGRWEPVSRRWAFDARDEARVRQILLDTFGSDGQPSPTVTARITVGPMTTNMAELRLAGRVILWQPSRDARTRLGENVVLIEGRLLGGGSRNNPQINATIGTILELRDWPEAAVALIPYRFHPTIPTERDRSLTLLALMSERAALVARLAVIDQEIARKEAGE